MDKTFTDRSYVVAAIKEGQRTEFWVAATARRDRAATAVQKVLPPGWKAVATGWRLTAEKVAKLKMRADSVCRLRQGT